MIKESIYLEDIEKEIVFFDTLKSMHKTIEVISSEVWDDVKGTLWKKHEKDIWYSDTRDSDTEWRPESAWSRSFLVTVHEMWEAVQKEIRGYTCQASDFPNGGEILYFGEMYKEGDKISIITESGTNR